MSVNNTFSIAYKYHALGRCVIPSGAGDKRKKPLVPWTSYQTTKPDATFICENGHPYEDGTR